MAKIQGMIGRKIGMTQVFDAFGQSVAVTVVEVGPCTVLQKKTQDHEGYNALQLGFMKRPLKRLNMPEQGHVKKAGLNHGFYVIKEVPVENPDEFELGQELTLNDLDLHEIVDIVSTTKGKGFQGTVKRHGFSRGRMGHGSKHHREMGSIGQSAFPSRIIKGKRMPGRMGGKRLTVKNCMVVDVRPEDNVILVKGPVPGAKNQPVFIKCK